MSYIDYIQVSNSVEFGNSWIVEGSECQDIGNDFQHVCNGVIERSAAELKCGMIRDESGMIISIQNILLHRYMYEVIAYCTTAP